MNPTLRRLLIAAAARYGTAPLLYGRCNPFASQVVSLAAKLAQNRVEHRTLLTRSEGFLPGTIRVHPDDDPLDPGARRWIRDDSGDFSAWMPVTGWGGPPYPDAELSDAEIVSYPVQPAMVWLRLMGHR